MHSFNGVNPPSIPIESSSDDYTSREIDDLSDDASSSSGDDGFFENPNDIPLAHIPVENTFKSSRLWHIPGCSSFVPPPSVDDSYVDECPGVLSDDSTYANYAVSVFVDDFYDNTHLKGMWGGSVMPVPEVDEWMVPDSIKKFICEAPSCPRQAGRPKLSRRRSSLESTTSPRKTQKCSRCNKPSHNRVNCREKCPIVQKSEEEGDEEDEEKEQE
ncbi:hypothetical protein ACS0TY_030581 [Phlomoides rotata]